MTADRDVEPRRKRADAVRNRQRILTAAEQLLAERGMEMTLDAVAGAAGIGVGTVYRQFSNKRELINELFEGYLRQIIDSAQAATRDPDPWRGLTRFVEATCEIIAGNRGFATAMSELQNEAILFEVHRGELMLPIAVLLDRAKKAGVVEQSMEPVDVLAIIGMIHLVAAITEPVAPENWRRYLAVQLNGFRTDAAPELPLHPAALSPDQLNRARAAAAARRKQP
ncbi:TetR/AcrR family transcriptional regulator [Nocardia sp. NPDC050630]|uniref:TetR/AcrR family transcriptional regulator n=1 Tax=Nocardia sp. NPDC050630 TaxID=3364321 RepID=UPI0037B7F67F